MKKGRCPNMRAGFITISVGFFLSTFSLNIEGIRILPPFIGLLIMICGLSKIRNYYSSLSAKASEILLIVNSIVSAAGSLVSLSKYAPDTLLESILPALPYVFAVSCILCAAEITLLMIHTVSFFERYRPENRLWKPVCYTVSAVYSAFKILEAAAELSLIAGFPPIMAYSDLFICVMVLVLLVLAAYSGHSAIEGDTADYH
ncbi:MAG: hypothetical protein J6128_06130 [Clostridia bacterium]|nr:hypothetical protein [Clostridia bacterium]